MRFRPSSSSPVHARVRALLVPIALTVLLLLALLGVGYRVHLADWADRNFLPPPPPGAMAPQLPFEAAAAAAAADTAAAEWIEAMQFRRACDPAVTPILVGGEKRSGLGDVFTYHLVGFHVALLTGRVYVYDSGSGSGGGSSSWAPNFLREGLRRSACQEAWEARPGDFQRVEWHSAGNGDPRALLRQAPFEGRPFLWWTQQLASRVLRPRAERVGRVLVSDLGSSGSGSGSGSEWEVDTLAEAPPADLIVGVHIRRGDSCTTLRVNYARPPCQPTEDYIAALRAILRQHQASGATVQVRLSTDQEGLRKEVRDRLRLEVQGVGAGAVHLLTLSGVDLDRYRPRGSLKIEDALTAADDRHQVVRDFWREQDFLAGSRLLVGQFFSNFLNLALFRAPAATGFASVDGALPCLRGGCPSPLAYTADRCDYYSYYRDLLPRPHGSWRSRLPGALGGPSTIVTEYCASLRCLPPLIWAQQWALFASGDRCSSVAAVYRGMTARGRGEGAGGRGAGDGAAVVAPSAEAGGTPGHHILLCSATAPASATCWY